jgi:predicted secreted protein
VEEFEVQGLSGEPITLPIALGPATGYVWSLELPSGVVRIDDAPRPVPEGASRIGGSAGGYLQVTAPQGDYVLLARLARPWETHRPVREVRMHLHVS